MVASTVLLQTENGSFSAYLARPDRPSGAGVVVLQEIFGVNANMRAVADAFSAAGFNAIVPDLFWRQEPGVDLDPATDRDHATELMKGLDAELAVADALVAADYLRALDGANGKIGAVGYCLGGKLAFLLAMTSGIDAAVSYYGVAIQAQLDQVGKVKRPLLLHLAEDDHLCPPEAQLAIEQAAAAQAGHIQVLRHPGVGHAFARINSPAYVPASAKVADAATFALLRPALGVTA